MKNISKIIIAFILITFINCKAQNPVVNLDAPQLNLPKGSYIKDINNVLNPFEGTWVFDDGVNYLKIVPEKKYQPFTGAYYQDMIIGEYQFKKNGQEIINSLPSSPKFSLNIGLLFDCPSFAKSPDFVPTTICHCNFTTTCVCCLLK